MPYIRLSDRKKYDAAIESLLGNMPEECVACAGDFTYIIYKLLARFNKRYWQRALGTGCLMMAIQEVYRREHIVYEDTKIKEEGDV